MVFWFEGLGMKILQRLHVIFALKWSNFAVKYVRHVKNLDLRENTLNNALSVRS